MLIPFTGQQTLILICLLKHVSLQSFLIKMLTLLIKVFIVTILFVDVLTETLFYYVLACKVLLSLFCSYNEPRHLILFFYAFELVEAE